MECIPYVCGVHCVARMMIKVARLSSDPARIWYASDFVVQQLAEGESLPNCFEEACEAVLTRHVSSSCSSTSGRGSEPTRESNGQLGGFSSGCRGSAGWWRLGVERWTRGGGGVGVVLGREASGGASGGGVVVFAVVTIFVHCLRLDLKT